MDTMANKREVFRQFKQELIDKHLFGETVTFTFSEESLNEAIDKAYDKFVAHLHRDLDVDHIEKLRRICFHFETSMYCRTDDVYYVTVKFIVM